MARGRISLWWVVPIVVVALAGGAAGGLLLAHHSPKRTTPATAAASRGSGSAGPGTGTTGPPAHSGAGRSSVPTTTTAPPPALAVVGASPGRKAVAVPATAAITVRFSAPLAASSPTPSLSPSTQGTWSVHGSTMTFTPSVPFLPLSVVTLTVPAGSKGPRSAAGGEMAQAYRSWFRVKTGSLLRLDQVLSLLDYSPLAWTPKGPPIAPTDTAAQIKALYQPPAGSFGWRRGGWPKRLRALWSPGHEGVMLRGLIMSFQADHGLVANGSIGPGLWNDLVRALGADQLNTGGYNFALASKIRPESLTIWHNGAVVVHAPANTGIAVDPTDDGIFPVYSRLRRQVMKGTNPDGSHYADPVQYVAYFNGGDAVHYIPRADYGIPQSLGCVELNLADAAKAWPYLAYGTLVDVIG